MKRLILSFLIPAVSFAEVLYTDGTKSIQTCVKSKQVATIDLKCPVQDIYFTPEIKAEIQKQTPETVAFVLNGKTGSLTAVCKGISYVFEIKSGKNCDLKKVVWDLRFHKKEDVKVSEFNKEELLNKARNLLAGMVKGKLVRGYDLKAVKIESVINDDDYFKIKINTVYLGGRLIGYAGTITNYSKYISKTLNIPDVMKKGYVLFYVEGMNDKEVVFKPEESKQVFIVALKNAEANKIPYVR